MKDKCNFTSIENVEKELYGLSRLLLEHKISPMEAQAFTKVCDSWIKARKVKDNENIIRRIAGLEELYKCAKKV